MVEHNNRNHDDLSRLLDRALASYAPEEPLGLSERVLGRVQENIRSRQQRRAFQLAFALASLCLAVLAWIVVPDRRPSRGQLALPALVPAERHAGPPLSPTSEYRQSAQALPPTIARQRRPGVLSSSRSRPSLPKLDQFPAPTSLTKEERALLRVPAQHAAGLLVSSRKSDITPIDIKPLEIEPF